ncbi:MAG TPA: ribonuclease H-like domain-containing protein, partial [Polyangiaceae bacterium]|nr:ribonuclease H-like domain-containing protein [Polyangiaceae bacterium]
VDLKGKLARLGSAAPVSRQVLQVRDAALADGSEPRPAGASTPPNAASADAEKGTTLQALRDKMQAILGREAPPPRRRADPTETDLPFVRFETPRGSLSRRLARLAPSHHVGRIPVDAAGAASAEVLALIALNPELANCQPRRALFLDTETTGLNGGAGVVAFLVGMAYFSGDGLMIEQLMLKSPADEPALLERVAECVEEAGLLVSYNGKAFDLPLLATRYVMNRLPPLPPRPHLDLVHVARRLHRHRLGACRLVHLESDVLGFERGPDIDGGDIPARYAHFLRTGDEAALRAVVEHNALDVVSMAALVGLYGEPLDALHAEDLVGLARTLRRAKALERAREAADAALGRGGGSGALRVRGEIHKALGDRAAALSDFEALSADVDDPAVRLELAKLYEHHAKDLARALELLAQGTSESPEASERRRARLERKLARTAAQRLRRRR